MPCVVHFREKIEVVRNEKQGFEIVVIVEFYKSTKNILD